MSRFSADEYYQRFVELQEKLRQSEEERMKLEIKLNNMMQVVQSEEQRHYNNLSLQYKDFWEEDKRRQDRNNYILRILDRVENQSAALDEKARRFNLFRDQYYGSYKREEPKMHGNYMNPNAFETESCNLSHFDQQSGGRDLSPTRSVRLQHHEKMDYMNKYLESLDHESDDKAKKKVAPVPLKNVEELPVKDSAPYLGEVGYKVENFLTNRYAAVNYDMLDDELVQPPAKAESVSSKSPLRSPSRKHYKDNPIDKYELEEAAPLRRSEKYLEPVVNNRSKRAPPKKQFSNDYRNSLMKLKKIQDNSRKILLENAAKTSTKYYPVPIRYDRPNNHTVSYSRRYFESPPTPLYEVYSPPPPQMQLPEIRLSLNDVYHQDQVIQKYLNEKHNNYISERYLYPYEFCRDRFLVENNMYLPPSRFGGNRFDPPDLCSSSYTNYNPCPFNRPMSRSYFEDEYHPYYPGQLNRMAPSVSDRYTSSSATVSPINNETVIKDIDQDIAITKKHFELNKKEATQEKKPGIHFNDKDEILEYDSRRPLSQTNIADNFAEKDEENFNSLDNDINTSNTIQGEDGAIDLQVNNNESKNISHEDFIGASKPRQLENGYHYESENISELIDDEHSENNTSQPQNVSINQDTSQLDTDIEPLEFDPGEAETINYNDVQEKVHYDNNSNQQATYNDSESAVCEDQVQVKEDQHAEIIPPTTDITSDVVSRVENQSQDSVKPTETTVNDIDSQLGVEYSETYQPVKYDEADQLDNYEQQSQPFAESGQYNLNEQFDEAAQLIDPAMANNNTSEQFDENGQPIAYDSNADPSQHYDESAQAIHYDESGQPIHYDESGQQIHYDSQQVQYDEHGQPIQYDENGQPLQYDPSQNQYDEHGQPIQYDENGQPIQYDPNQEQIQYDENGQPVRYDENGQPVHYDEHGQVVQYDDNGQSIADGCNQQVVVEGADEQLAHTEQRNVVDLLDTDTESVKQDVTKASEDSNDFNTSS